MHKQVHHQQIALVFEYRALVRYLTTDCSHHQGVSVHKDTYSIIQLVISNW